MKDSLAPVYGEGEAKAMIRLIFHSLKDWNMTDLIIHEGDEISPYIEEKVETILARLANQEPIQYILGEAYFYGMDLEVNPSTLIPRGETEELVDMIVKENRGYDDLKVLDIGTGSGAIAIALARNLPFSKVTAIDISEKAIETAKRNATKLKAKIEFIKADIFEYVPEVKKYDILVSNPPYIDESEKADMERNVLDYEPHTALFVPDNQPLIYYSRISTLGVDALVDGGRLYFEINPRHGEDLVLLLEKDGYRRIEIHRDMHGKDRFISAILEKPE